MSGVAAETKDSLRIPRFEVYHFVLFWTEATVRTMWSRDLMSAAGEVEDIVEWIGILIREWEGSLDVSEDLTGDLKMENIRYRQWIAYGCFVEVLMLKVSASPATNESRGTRCTRISSVKLQASSFETSTTIPRTMSSDHTMSTIYHGLAL